MRYQNIIWDMDGTLLDTLADVLESVNHTMRVFSLPERTREDVRKFVGNGIIRFVELCVRPAAGSTRNSMKSPHTFRSITVRTAAIKQSLTTGLMNCSENA